MQENRKQRKICDLTGPFHRAGNMMMYVYLCSHGYCKYWLYHYNYHAIKLHIRTGFATFYSTTGDVVDIKSE